jgi:flagellar biosynthesis/type III secretory pathway protein FliH
MDSSSTSRTLRVMLPRFSAAALLLCVGLALMMAMVVGLAAYTIHAGSGISQADLAVAKRLAYQQGHDAGYSAGMVKGKSTGRDAGYKEGRHDGMVAGTQKGRRAGFRKGHAAGYNEGYAAGVAAGQAAAAASASHTSKKKSGN